MEEKKEVNDAISIIAKESIWDKKTMLFVVETLFKRIDFTGKNVLEIGGGAGVFCFYAACKGAKKVICLEPEGDGSTEKITESFNRMKDKLNYDNVELKYDTFQEFEPGNDVFDVIILHDSINHLNEDACINLLKDTKSSEIYIDLFKKMYALSGKGSTLVLSDCSKYNFFNLLGITNPFAHTIEWFKHQKPETWVELLKKVGYKKPEIRWYSINRLRHFGRIFFGNKVMAYFFKSYFCITINKD